MSTLKYAPMLAILLATPLAAQGEQIALASTPEPAKVEASDTTDAAAARLATAPKIQIQHLRPYDQRGVNVFEAPKRDDVRYEGFKLDWGAAFTQQFQGLDHSNTATAKVVNNVNANQLVRIGHGFNNAEANLYMNAQVARRIRVSLTSYLSARHHNETWVKDGYFLIDDSPIENAFLENIMKYLTLRVGHFEINYGDAHFRRTDGGNAMYNPLVGNYIMDAFTTEIGAEAYVRKSGFIAMAGITGGEIRGTIRNPDKRAPSYLAKLGFDKQLTDAFRARLTGSLYTTKKSASNTLYSGDRAGSRYFDVVENTVSTEKDNAWSGAIRPGFASKITAMQLNPFVKIGGLEFFGVAEQAKGRAATEAKDRTWNQYVGEVTYRFLADERVFVAGRYNTAKGELVGITNKVSVDRYNLGGGWFVTPNVMAKLEWVNQKYNDFPTADIRNGGKFKGFLVEGVVAF
jgi:hypothetical protein